MGDGPGGSLSRCYVYRKARHKKPNYAQLMIVTGMIILAGVVLLLKIQKPATAETQPSSGQTPEIQLTNALKAGKPTLGFFHSDNCDSCIQMMEIVAQVYQMYSERVVLVDVNVYDQQNVALLRQEQIRVIPTLIFFNERGQKQTVLGVIPPDQLRAQLNAIAGE